MRSRAMREREIRARPTDFFLQLISVREGSRTRLLRIAVRRSSLSTGLTRQSSIPPPAAEASL